MAYHRFHKVDTHIVRIFNTYGPRMRLDDGRVVPNFILQGIKKQPLTIYGDGAQTRSFCYVSDLIEGIYKLLISEEHFPVNIGNPQEISIKQFAEEINKLTKNPGGIVYKEDQRLGDDPQRRQPDIKRARSILNWEPKVGLDEGLTQTIEYFTVALASL
jgi:dTDP-glucose 4,6-dehydratase